MWKAETAYRCRSSHRCVPRYLQPNIRTFPIFSFFLFIDGPASTPPAYPSGAGNDVILQGEKLARKTLAIEITGVNQKVEPYLSSARNATDNPMIRPDLG